MPRGSSPDCVPAFPVRDERHAPHLRPGDILVPVSCRHVQPRLGDYVLVHDDGTGYDLLRFIALDGPGHFLGWDGRAYRRPLRTAVAARILAARRGEEIYDLVVSRGFPGRDRLYGWLHRCLARARGARRTSAPGTAPE